MPHNRDEVQILKYLLLDHLANIHYTFSDSDTRDLNMVLSEHYEWYATLHREEASRGPGRNKLRTYRKFKSNFEPESYVTGHLPRAQRRATALFRCGVAPIRIETGRYERIKVL